MSENETPDWYDESKITKAIFAFENGHGAYSGWVVDLGDGTCRFANAPLLGEDGPKWGDRVDLFYHPCSPLDMPMVGYRIYGEGEEPVGRSFGVKREPTEKDRADYEAAQRRRDELQQEAMDTRFQMMDEMSKRMEADRKAYDEFIRYSELSAWVKDQGLEIPEDLHEKKREPVEKTPEERKDTKLFLLASAYVDYADVTVTPEEIRAKVNEHAKENKQADAILAAFEEAGWHYEPDTEDEDCDCYEEDDDAE